MTRDALLKEALELSHGDRADVASKLLASLEDDSDDPMDIENAWAAEVERRGRRVLAGESTGRPWDEVRKRLEERLAKR